MINPIPGVAESVLPFQSVKGLSRHKRERNGSLLPLNQLYAARIYSTFPLTAFLGNINILTRCSNNSPGHPSLTGFCLFAPGTCPNDRDHRRNAAIVMAYATGAYSYQEIADYFKIHFTTVGRVVRNR